MTHAEWAGEMAKQMRIKKLTGRKLAELTGYTNVYISMVLSGTKTSQEARRRIENAIANYKATFGVGRGKANGNLQGTSGANEKCKTRKGMPSPAQKA